MDYIAQEFDHAGCRVQIIQDQYARSPREVYDHVGSIVFLNKRDMPYSDDASPKLDEHEDLLAYLIEKLLPAERVEVYENRPGVETFDNEKLEDYWRRTADITKAQNDAWLKECQAHGTILFLRFIDYGSSGCKLRITGEFDDCNGVIFCSNEHAKEEALPDAAATLSAEIEEYDKYLQGDVWGFELRDIAYPEINEACWGFFGMDECIEEAKSTAESLAAQRETLLA